MSINAYFDQLIKIHCPDSASPTWPEDPLQALLECLEVVASSDGPTLWHLDQQEALQATIALATDKGRAELALATLVSQLIPVTTPWYEDMTFYVDPHCDEDGHCRVYLRDEQVLPGTDVGAFASVEGLAAWLADTAVGNRPDFPLPINDDWEKKKKSAAHVHEELLQGKLSRVWQAARDNKWSKRPKYFKKALAAKGDDRSAGWQRRLCLCLLSQVIATGRVELPSEITEDDLDQNTLRYFDFLKALQLAPTAEVPDFILRLAQSETPVAETADRWIATFARAYGLVADEPAGLAGGSSSFEQLLFETLYGLLNACCTAELIDVEADNRESLAITLTNAAMEVKHPKAILRTILRILESSPLVEEIYASDREIMDVFRSGFE